MDPFYKRIDINELFLRFGSISNRSRLYHFATNITELDFSRWTHFETLSYIERYKEQYDTLAKIFIETGKLNEICLSNTVFSEGFFSYLSRLGAKRITLSSCCPSEKELLWIFKSMRLRPNSLTCLDLRRNFIRLECFELISKFIMDNIGNIDLYNFRMLVSRDFDSDFHMELQEKIDDFICKLQNKERMFLILLERHKNENSVFSKYNLPLDIMKIIYKLVLGIRFLL